LIVAFNVHVPLNFGLPLYVKNITPPYEAFVSLAIDSHVSQDAPLCDAEQGGVGVNPPLELDILQKLYYLHKGD